MIRAILSPRSTSGTRRFYIAQRILPSRIVGLPGDIRLYIAAEDLSCWSARNRRHWSSSALSLSAPPAAGTVNGTVGVSAVSAVVAAAAAVAGDSSVVSSSSCPASPGHHTYHFRAAAAAAAAIAGVCCASVCAADGAAGDVSVVTLSSPAASPVSQFHHS